MKSSQVARVARVARRRLHNGFLCYHIWKTTTENQTLTPSPSQYTGASRKTRGASFVQFDKVTKRRSFTAFHTWEVSTGSPIMEMGALHPHPSRWECVQLMKRWTEREPVALDWAAGHKSDQRVLCCTVQ